MIQQGPIVYDIQDSRMLPFAELIEHTAKKLKIDVKSESVLIGFMEEAINRLKYAVEHNTSDDLKTEYTAEISALCMLFLDEQGVI